MKILNDSECSQWLEAHNFEYENPVRGNGREGGVYLPETGLHRVFGIPSETDAERQIFLSRHLARWLNCPEILLWVTSWAMYTERQMFLFLQFRRRFGETRRLIDAPGHLFDGTDTEELWRLGQLLLCLTAFNWEGFVLSDNGSDVIWMADEIIETFTLNQKKDARMRRIVRKLGLK